MTDTHNRHAPEQPTHDAIPLVTVETHLVVSIDATVRQDPTTGDLTVHYSRPEVCVENPFPEPSGPLWQPDDCEWYTPQQLSDRYDIPVMMAYNLAIGPDITVSLKDGSPDGGR